MTRVASIEQVRVFTDIVRERRAQDEKWGANRELVSLLWCTILGEEYGESCQAALHRDHEHLREELIQLAAVAVAMVESIDNGTMGVWL